jgi:hypothetical protein
MFAMPVMLLRPRCGVSTVLRVTQNFGREARAFRTQRFVQVDGSDFAISGSLFGQRDDLSQARRYQDPFPQPVIAHSERAADFGVNFAGVDAGRVEAVENRRVALFEQGH